MSTAVPIRFPGTRKSGPGCGSPAPVPVLTITERARRYIAKCPPAISGQRGHDATFRVAAVLWNGFGLSETDTLAAAGRIQSALRSALERSGAGPQGAVRGQRATCGAAGIPAGEG